jgi:hypothetical protein
MNAKSVQLQTVGHGPEDDRKDGKHRTSYTDHHDLGFKYYGEPDD